jgi:hypothetical protein
MTLTLPSVPRYLTACFLTAAVFLFFKINFKCIHRHQSVA